MAKPLDEQADEELEAALAGTAVISISSFAPAGKLIDERSANAAAAEARVCSFIPTSLGMTGSDRQRDTGRAKVFLGHLQRLTFDVERNKNPSKPLSSQIGSSRLPCLFLLALYLLWISIHLGSATIV